MLDLVTSLQQQDFFANLVLEDVVEHPFGVEVRELNWECFERMAFWDIVLDASLKLFVCESLSA
jgi:hypothetical protein